MDSKGLSNLKFMKKGMDQEQLLREEKERQELQRKNQTQYAQMRNKEWSLEKMMDQLVQKQGQTQQNKFNLYGQVGNKQIIVSKQNQEEQKKNIENEDEESDENDSDEDTMESSKIDDFETIYSNQNNQQQTEEIKEDPNENKQEYEKEIQELKSQIEKLRQENEDKNKIIAELKVEGLKQQIKADDSKVQTTNEKDLLGQENITLRKELTEISSKYSQSLQSEETLKVKVRTLTEEATNLKGICEAMGRSRIGMDNQKQDNLKNEIQTLQELLNNVDADTFTQIVMEKTRQKNLGQSAEVLNQKLVEAFEDQVNKIHQCLKNANINVRINFE